MKSMVFKENPVRYHCKYIKFFVVSKTYVDISQCFLSSHHPVPFHEVGFEHALHLQSLRIVRLVYMQFQISAITSKSVQKYY